ncbi:hypothetical protein BAUCODRAFT_149282 [Baudoinia panamericana UAMH 10762]|uniref:Uncharacterized protein n=1 Tax=Baudoinia panamericana (strain UAMH 10762) TaxID=717646 RepID=M2N852_BAUPA|nr:uncharacterized protein BAUCODRAFT_149282 [Baudoinia panamericana UAMH 10762]EMC95279.1 hypothetical protein BAUCODRAFT_149282 [Baudoinia panamericana UAMH 10762]
MPVQKTAYITGGASGIGLALARTLAHRGIRLAIADLNISTANSVASDLCAEQNAPDLVTAFELNAADWDSQLSVFQKVVEHFEGRVDYVYPIAGIGEKVSIPNDGGKGKGFVKPNLSVLDVDLYGVLFTVSLAVQQMRRQERDESGFRGKIATVASVCGFYCVPTLPIYTAAKHGVIGFIRSFGKYLPEEHITLNAVCPNVVRTGISTSAFYDKLESQGLLTPMKPVIDAFEKFLDSDISGECWEAGPKGDLVKREAAEYLDRESGLLMDMLYERGHGLHQPQS